MRVIPSEYAPHECYWSAAFWPGRSAEASAKSERRSMMSGQREELAVFGAGSVSLVSPDLTSAKGDVDQAAGDEAKGT